MSHVCCPAAKWTGATCKVPVDTCTNSSSGGLACMNGGSCMLDTDSNEYYCKCPPNVRGRHCQFGVKECKDGMYCMVRPWRVARRHAIWCLATCTQNRQGSCSLSGRPWPPYATMQSRTHNTFTLYHVGRVSKCGWLCKLSHATCM